MPTPVGAARQCLSDSAAAVLDHAVAAARRRSHAHTTTLHVVFALLAVPSSPLREACTRAWSSTYSPRLQFRAMDLCVGVALDRVSVSKISTTDEPPVSNSLMAAIKRSQGSQRRHPETFHLYQQQLSSGSQNSPSISAVKVELKHFLTSILDDPIVSRVFDDAGFRTQEIKLAVLNPLAMSRFAVTSSRPPPLFTCSLDNFDLDRRAHSFPSIEVAVKEKIDGNSQNIGKILLKKTRRNPLLIGASANDAYSNFVDCLKKGESGLDGCSVFSIEREISECIGERLSEAMIGLKFKKVDEIVENCQGPGVIANCGDFKEFLGVELVEFVSNVVSKLKSLLINHGGKLWLIGFSADDVYKKLVEQFPSIEMDLDLHLLPITASSMGEKPFKSSLMRSFVPFGGFFSMSSELKSPCTNVMKPMKLCNSCNEKYEKEVSDVQKGVSTDSVADKQSVNLSSWLQIAECETSKKSCTEECRLKKTKTILDARILVLQGKWSGICQRLHCSTSQVDRTLPKPHASIATTLQHVPIRKDAVSVGSLSNGNNVSNLSPRMPSDWQKNSPPKQNVARPAELGASVIAQAEVPAQGLELNCFRKSSSSQQRTSLTIACTSSPSVVSVATDLTLGTFCDSSVECRRNPSVEDDCSGIHNSDLSRSQEKSMSQLSQSSSCSHHHGKQMYAKDLEQQWDVLAKKVYWQSEAIQTIGRALSRCRDEKNAGYHCSKKRNVWLSFVGPDIVGKRKIATSVAEIAFGRKDHLLYLDLCAQDTNPFNCVVDCYDSKYVKMQPGRELIVDYLAGELKKHPDSVVLLENVEKADFLVRSSLSQAIKTGKFPDSRARPIYLNNNIFILASTVVKGSKDLLFGKEAPEFPEETILKAKNTEMQILVQPVGEIYIRNSTTCVSLFPSEIISSQFCSRKRKSLNDGSTKGEISTRACQLSRSFDLNLPVDGMGEDSDIDESDDDYLDDSAAWLGELLEYVDENVVSKPFDFDSLSQKILREINVRLRKIVRATVLLEIDRHVMVQILAAVWLTEREEALENWIEQVLCSGIDEACKRCNLTSDFVLKLVPCDGLVVKARAPRVCLPAKINV